MFEEAMGGKVGGRDEEAGDRSWPSPEDGEDTVSEWGRNGGRSLARMGSCVAEKRSDVIRDSRTG
jgi:hypothetical protein